MTGKGKLYIFMILVTALAGCSLPEGIIGPNLAIPGDVGDGRSVLNVVVTGQFTLGDTLLLSHLQVSVISAAAASRPISTSNCVVTVEDPGGKWNEITETKGHTFGSIGDKRLKVVYEAEDLERILSITVSAPDPGEPPDPGGSSGNDGNTGILKPIIGN